MQLPAENQRFAGASTCPEKDKRHNNKKQGGPRRWSNRLAGESGRLLTRERDQCPLRHHRWDGHFLFPEVHRQCQDIDEKGKMIWTDCLYLNEFRLETLNLLQRCFKASYQGSGRVITCWRDTCTRSEPPQTHFPPEGTLCGPSLSDNVVLRDGDRPAQFQPLLPQNDKEQPVMVKLRNTVMQWCH